MSTVHITVSTRDEHISLWLHSTLDVGEGLTAHGIMDVAAAEGLIGKLREAIDGLPRIASAADLGLAVERED